MIPRSRIPTLARRPPPAGGRCWLPMVLWLVLCCAAAGCSRDEADDAPQAAASEAEATDGEATDGEADGEDDEEATDRDQDPVPVETVRLARGEIETVLRFSTNLEAESDVQVFSQAARLVTELAVEEGDTVRRGQLLLRLQDDEQQSALARVESQLARARREYQRQQNLFAQNLISEQTMNEATYEVEQLELAASDARRDLSYTEVRAPIAGTITGRQVNLGDHVTVNQHLFDLVDFDTIVARVYVPERELPRLAVGQKARLYTTSMDGDEGAASLVGRVLRWAPIVDPRSGTVKVTVKIPRRQGLLPGMYVEVELVTEVNEDALLVPKRAVVYDQNQVFLYRLSDDLEAERLRLEVRLEDREHIEPAPGSGLEPGDEVVVAGQAGLKAGVPVRRVGGDAAAADAAAADAADAGEGPDIAAGPETP